MTVEDKDLELLPILSDVSNDEELLPRQEEFEGLPPSAQWQYIVEEVVSTLMEEEVPDRVIAATEYLICGFPVHKTAKKVGTSTNNVKSWLKKYPAMAKAVKVGQKNLHMWRLARLEQQFLDAINKSEEIINIDLHHSENASVDQKMVATVAQHARFLINLYVGKKMDITVHGNEDDQPVINVDKEALEYLEDALGKQETVEATYRVVDKDPNDSKPLFDPNGDPLHGEMGEFDTTEEGTLCHICGERKGTLKIHVNQGHKVNDREYESLFMLPKGSLRDVSS